MYKRQLPIRVERVWTHSGSGSPFGPHFELDGDVYANDEEYFDAAAASSVDFPFVDVYAPGDHVGCGCTLEPTVSVDLSVGQSQEIAA